MNLNARENKSASPFEHGLCQHECSNWKPEHSISLNNSLLDLNQSNGDCDGISGRKPQYALDRLFPDFDYGHIPHAHHYIAGSIVLAAFLFGTIGNLASLIAFCR